MKVAVSITKVFETDAVNIADLACKMEEYDEDDEDYIDWYDLEPEREIWSYAILSVE